MFLIIKFIARFFQNFIPSLGIGIKRVFSDTIENRNRFFLRIGIEIVSLFGRLRIGIAINIPFLKLEYTFQV